MFACPGLLCSKRRSFCGSVCPFPILSTFSVTLSPYTLFLLSYLFLYCNVLLFYADTFPLLSIPFSFLIRFPLRENIPLYSPYSLLSIYPPYSPPFLSFFPFSPCSPPFGLFPVVFWGFSVCSGGPGPVRAERDRRRLHLPIGSGPGVGPAFFGCSSCPSRRSWRRPSGRPSLLRLSVVLLPVFPALVFFARASWGGSSAGGRQAAGRAHKKAERRRLFGVVAPGLYSVFRSSFHFPAARARTIIAAQIRQ